MTVLATAGHVDHGKSTFVNFLTNQETDRLAEEKKRGLTINLGYTYFKEKNQTYSIVMSLVIVIFLKIQFQVFQMQM